MLPIDLQGYSTKQPWETLIGHLWLSICLNSDFKNIKPCYLFLNYFVAISISIISDTIHIRFCDLILSGPYGIWTHAVAVKVRCATATPRGIITRHILNYCLTAWLSMHPEHKTGFEPVLIICYKQKFAVCVLKVIFKFLKERFLIN